jgi:hypothetical protein
MTIFTPDVVGYVELTINRPGVGGTYVLGIYQQPVGTTFQIVANIQPADHEDLMKLPELERSKEVIVLFTPTELKPGNQSAKQNPDTFDYLGNTYEVFKVAVYRMGVLDHTEAICVRTSQ